LALVEEIALIIRTNAASPISNPALSWPGRPATR